ncbi:MAG: hypothetical protein K5686_03960 [Lachnospiraceae bacterium]|nr:hypothetical protein [Lachnospiraceae bacterium]
MRAVILYRKEDAVKNRGYIELFTREFEKRGVGLSLVYTEDMEMPGLPELVINRSRSLRAAYFFEERGVKVSNPPEICRIGNDKLYAYELMKDKGIPLMRTSRDPGDIGLPCVIKTVDGHGGDEVFLVNSVAEQKAVLKKLAGRKLLFQEVCDTPGRDLRIYIVGNRIVAGMMRSSDNDFRSNYSLGGKAERHKLTEEEEMIAMQVMEGMTVDHAAIDLIYHRGHPVFNELEDAAGSRMLYANTDINIVKLYADHLMRNI